MSRMTRPKDNWDCRIRECRAEEWMRDVYGHYPRAEDICSICPFFKHIKRLAEYEDLVEKMKREGEVTLDDFRELDEKFD